MLTRSDFEGAVKDALRHYSQADLLAGNALLRTRLLTRSEASTATPQALRALLAETAQSLFAGERDQRLYRVLDLTYLHPAAKQEAAADRLGLSFSTYRRHLTTVVDRLTEWLWQQEQEALQAEAVIEQTTGSATAAKEPVVPSQRPRLSIVILPFLNLSQDPSVDYLVDGIGDSLITDLSRALPGSFVISRSTAFTYKGRQVAIRQIGQELSVRFVLEGSVLAEPRRVRVNVQLIDAETDEHLWAERFDKERKDILGVQDEIVARLSRSVGLEMIRSEAARGSASGSGDAIDLVMRARALANDIKRRENAAHAVELFRQALEFDPSNVDALVGMATLCSYQVLNLYRLDERDVLLDEAEGLISRAAALAPDHTGVLKARALLLRARGQFADAVVATAAVIACNPGEPTCYKEMGLNKLYLGETQEAAEWFRRADAIAPRDPDRWTWLQGLGRALIQLGEDAEAVDVLSQAMDNHPGYLRGKAWLAAAEALAGDTARARLHMAEYLAVEPEMTARRFAEGRSSVPLGITSQVYRHEIERILEGLRRAGMPDAIGDRPSGGPEREMTKSAAPSTARELAGSVSELIGREAELSEVADLIRTHRLVTLIGEGGVGKTRLGIEVGRRLLAGFADGAGVAELAPLSDPGLVPVTVASALGLKFAAGSISAERVANVLGTQRLVLVLDNCEHVIDAAAYIVRVLLQINPAIRVLATSREPLRTEGEYLYRVRPLAVPAKGTDDRDEVLRYGAVQLFLTRARAADPHLSLDGDAPVVAAAICRRLDGIPLAIELAAASAAALGLEELASRLDDRFRLLTAGHRTAPPRHQTLRATLDWSYELLPEPERMVLRRLAIFAGSFGLKAADKVAASTEIASSAVIDCVANLITKSLVSADVGGTEEHYRLLETTRAYAFDKLIESSELASVGRCHAEYYRDVFERAASELETRPVAEWLAAYKPRIDNVRAALDWAFSPDGDASVGVALTVFAMPLWMHLSLLDECRGRVEQALSGPGSGASRGARQEMQLYAALGASLIYTKGPAPEAASAWTNALQIAEELDDTECQLRALRGLWAYRLNSGEFRAALTLAQRFCGLAVNPANPADGLVGERMTGTALHYLGDQANARQHLEHMLDGYVTPVRRTHPIRFQFDQRVTARATLARILCLQGFPDQGMRAAQSSLEDAKASEHELLLCNVLVQAACPLALFVGDLVAAETYVAMLLDHSGKHGLTLWHLRGRCYKGVLLEMTGEAAAGLQLLGTALEELRQTVFAGHYMTLLGGFAGALGRAGQVAQGLVAIEEALARSDRTQAHWCTAELLRIKGELLLQEGAPNSTVAAEDHIRQALDWAQRQGALSWELRAAMSLARLWRDQERDLEAHELLASVYDRFTEGFETADLRVAKALIDELRARSEDLAKLPSRREVAGGAAAAPRRSVANVPEPVSELIGREAELPEVADLIRTHRLVTLIGEGGVGKTRLGIEVARRMLAGFADGVGVAELAPLTDPGLVPVTVAAALGLRFVAGVISVERVANALGSKQLVLVLDNCEHVIDAAAHMARELLQTNPAIRVLATSREPLRTEGEFLYRVPPLALPAAGTDDIDELLRHGAVQLFVTRAQAADPHFSSDARTTAVAAAICRRLDGIPLAIELAAARSAALGVAEIASRLDDRFHLLTGGHRTAPPRQQTLRATLDWSYELLPEPERTVLRRLAIFAGNFTLAAAVATSAEITEFEVVDCVARLVTKSLVTSNAGDAPAQYRLLETTRAYVLEKLRESREFDSVARCHADFYRGFFERANAEWEMRPTAEWMPDNGCQIDNLRAALDWSFSTSGDATIGVALTVAAAPLWMHLSQLDECRERVERALAFIGPESQRDSRREMKLYVALGRSLFYTKGPVQATGAALANALTIAESLADTDYQLQALYGLWVCAVFSGEIQAAHALAERFRRLAAKTGAANLLIGERLIGNSLHYLGNQIEARRHVERMLANYVAPVQRWQMHRFHVDQRSAGRLTLARILWLQGLPDQALRTAQGAIEDGQASGHVLSLCNGLALGACPIALFVGELVAAEYFVAMLLDYSTRHGLAMWHACGRCFEGVLLTRRGNIDGGLRLLRNSIIELRETGSKVYYTSFLGAVAEAFATIGDLAQGLEAIDEALERAENNKEQWCLAELLRIKGELLLLAGAPNTVDAARDHFLKALDWARRQGALAWELRAAMSLARLERAQERSREGYELLKAVYERFTEGFGTADLVAAKTLLAAL